jgi:hypothetical protein
MSKFYLLQNSFRAGEFGPRLLGRTDAAEYREACSELLNFVPLDQGGVARRMGSKYVYTSLSRPSIIPFVFSKTEGFAILINHDGTNPTVIDKNGDLQKVILSDQVFAGRDMSSWEDWVSTVDPNGWHFTQSGDIIILVHNSAEVPPVSIKRIEDGVEGVYFFFEWYLLPDGIDDQDRTQVLRWTFQPINIKEEWLQIGPRVATIFHDITARESQSSGATEIPNFWDAGDVGSLIRIIPYQNIDAPGAVEYLFRVEGLVDDTGSVPSSVYPAKSSVATCKIIYPPEYPASIPDPSVSQYMTKDWKKSYWSDTNGWPKSVSAFEQRLFFGGNKNFPDTLWSSLTGNLFHMMKERFEQDKNVTDKKDDVTRLNYFGVETAADPLELIPAAAEVNKIQWLHGGSALMVGTIGAEYILTGGAQGLASDNLNFRRQTAVGSSPIQTASLKNTVYYNARTGRRLHDLITDPVDLVSESRDLNVLNEDIISHQSLNLEEIVRVSSQVATNTVWVLTSANALIGFTSSEAGQVNAWHRHVIGDIEGREAQVISIGVIPNESGSFDDLWLATVRFGLGIKLLATDDSNTGADASSGTSGLAFINYAPEAVVPVDPAKSYPSVSRRVVTKFPSGVTASTLANTYFTIDDGDAWHIWFKDIDNPGTQPSTASTFVITVDMATTNTLDEIISLSSVAINDTSTKFCLESDAVGPTATTVTPANHPHFNVNITNGTGSTKMTSDIEVIPSTSSEDSLVLDIQINNEYIELDTPSTQYYFFFGIDPVLGGKTGIFIDISGGLTAENQHKYVLDQLKSAIDAQPFTVTIPEKKRFDTLEGYETLERIGEGFSNDKLFNDSINEADKPYYSDASLRVIQLAGPATTFSGFDHLAGDTVEVLADGFYIGQKVVTPTGDIELDAPAEEVIAGYAYQSIVATFPIEAGADWGSTVGVVQRIDKAITIFYKTFGAKVGPTLDDLEDLELLPDDYLMGEQLPLFTGRQQTLLPASPDDLQFVIIEQSKPLPCTVVAVAMRGRTYDSSQ